MHAALVPENPLQNVAPDGLGEASVDGHKVPVALQACRGAVENATWMTVAHFDLANESHWHYVSTGCERIALVDKLACFRVVARQAPHAVLWLLTRRGGWQEQ